MLVTAGPADRGHAVQTDHSQGWDCPELRQVEVLQNPDWELQNQVEVLQNQDWEFQNQPEEFGGNGCVARGPLRTMPGKQR